MPDHLEPYRRHVSNCPHRAKGQGYSLCKCPIWAYGKRAGKPFRQSLHTTDAQTAMSRIDALLHGAAPRDSLSLAHAADEYLGWAERNLAAGTVALYRLRLRLLAESFPDDPLQRIDAAKLSHFLAARNVAPRTRQTDLISLKTFFNWCVRVGYLGANPCRGVTVARVAIHKAEPLSDQEIAACHMAVAQMSTAADRERMPRVMLILLRTGLRVGDLCRLRPTHLIEGRIVMHTQKRDNIVRVAITPDVEAAIRAGGFGCPETIRAGFRELSRLVGFRVHPHRFRDTFAARLLSGGADLRTVQLLLGHASLRTTEVYYAQYVPEHQRLLDEAVARLRF